METTKVLTWTSTTYAFIAAVLWLFASIQKVTWDDSWYDRQTKPVPASPMEISQNGREVDTYRTAKAQTSWNARAALATAISVFCQATAQILQILQH